MKSDIHHLIVSFKNGEAVPPIVVDRPVVLEIVQMLAGAEIGSLDDLIGHPLPGVFVWRRDEDKRNFLVAQAREIIAQAYMHASPDRGTIIIIEGIDTFTVEAANCLLKVFEEPPAGILFVLTAESAERILPTIQSRAVICIEDSPTHAIPDDLRQRIEDYCLGEEVPLITYLYMNKLERDQYIALLSTLLQHARDGRLRGIDRIEQIDRALTTIFTTNVNPRGVVDTIFLGE